MKITKAQSLQNRAHIVETASALFRERGYDGVSVADLMVAAGLTHGGFYKHFGSKADLMAEATSYGLSTKMHEYENLDIAGFVERYLSRQHRDQRAEGCMLAALSGDAARQSVSVKAAFESGFLQIVSAVEQAAVAKGGDLKEARASAISLFSQMLGALVLSRACPDESSLSDEILEVCRRQMFTALAHEDQA